MSDNDTRLALQSAELLLSRIDASSEHGKTVHELFSIVADEGRKLQHFELNPDPDRSDAFNAAKLEAQRSRLAESLRESTKGAEQVINSLQATQRSRQIEAANLTESEHSAEIRSVFRGLDRAEKLAFIDAALKTDDKAIVAALTNPSMSPLLIGLPADEMSRYRTHYLDKFLPKDDKQLDNLRAVTRTFKQAFMSI